jgi:hypothetical protein
MAMSLFSGVPLSLAILMAAAPVMAEDGKPPIGEDLYELCSSFPHNSQCNGYEIPIALADRPGQIGRCLFKKEEEQEQGADCKVVAEESEITIYQEVEGKLKVLKDRSPTRIVKLMRSQIGRFEYRQDREDRTGARVLTTLAFGLPGLLMEPDRDISQFLLEYSLPTTDSAQKAGVGMWTFVVDRSAVPNIRSQLEKSVGRPPESPALADSKPTESKPADSEPAVPKNQKR